MLLFVVAALCISAATTIQIDTRDGGYVGVKVSINKDVPYDESVVDNIKVRLNGCSKSISTVEYTAQCGRPNCTVDLDCNITPRLSKLFPVESSIMFLPYMGSKMKYFCDDRGLVHDHNRKAPSMQNEMCNQRSTWTVINGHADFKNLPTPNLSKPILVDFEEVQQKEQLAQRVVLVLDVSTSMTDYNRMEDLIKGATSYVQHIKDNTRRLAIVTFSTDATTVRSLMLVNGTTRGEYLDEIEKLRPSGYTCIGCGLKNALKELTSPKESAEGGVIVLVTDGEENVDPPIREMLPKLIEAKAVVSTVGLVSEADKQLLELASSTGGKAFSMRDSSWPRDMLLEEIFESTTLTKNDDTLHLKVSLYSSLLHGNLSRRRTLADFEVGENMEVHMSKNHPGAVEARPADASDWRCKDWCITDGTGQKRTLIPMPDKQLMERQEESTNTFKTSFYVDSQSVNDTEVTLRKDHPGNITVSVVKPSGQVCNECNITYDGNSTRILLPTPAEVGNWTVYISSSASKLGIEIAVASRVKNTDEMAAVSCEMETWDPQKPDHVAIYATVKQGNRVFMDVVVYAEVFAPDPLDNSTKVRLYDNGRVPDNYADDGTYSGRFSQYTGRGSYIVRVHVQAQKTARLGHKQIFHAGAIFTPPMGLGTSLNAASGDPEGDVQEREPTLSMQAECGYFHLAEDFFYWQLPPAYVSNLKATALDPKPNGTLLVQLTWTWPGAHMYIGNASGVTIRASEDFFKLKDNFDDQTEISSANVVEGNLDPLPPHARHVVTIALPAIFTSLRSDGGYKWAAWIAIRVTNSHGLSSITSWVVDVSYPPRDDEIGMTVWTDTGVTLRTETGMTVTAETGVTLRTETGMTVTAETGVTVPTETSASVTITGTTVTAKTGVTVPTETSATVTITTAASTKVEMNSTNKVSEDEDDSESAWFTLIWACVTILVFGAVLLAVYITAIRKRMKDNTPDELLTGQTSESQTGPTSGSQEETVTKTVA